MVNHSLTTYDDRLWEIPHLDAYPSMLPFIGESYENPLHRKMLLIGESYYLPEASTGHHDVPGWYEGSEKNLNPEEISYMNCRGLVGGGWSGKGHGIFREINRCLEELPLDSAARGISHIAFMNAFFRPAHHHGDSFRKGCAGLDREKSKEITEAVLRIINPDLVVYVSKYSWDTVGSRVARSFPETSFDFTCHPGDPRWWHRKNYKHEVKKFRRILRDQFLTLSAPATS